MDHGGPPAEVEITEDLVRGLLADQCPALADRPLRAEASGWDNVIYRLGDAHAVRLPRREVAVPLIRNEIRWLPELAPRLPLPTPAPVHIGRPGRGYPWPWTVSPWFRGRSAAETPPVDLGAAADDLGGFIAALRRPAPADAPRNPWRGVPLVDRSEILDGHLATLRGEDPDLADRIAATWSGLVVTPAWTGPPMWLHGDLHPANLVVEAGRLSAVIDFGDLCAGDPAGDLSGGWLLLPAEHHDRFRRAAGGSEVLDADTWQRARAWALVVATAIRASGGPWGTAPLQRVAAATLDRVLEPV